MKAPLLIALTALTLGALLLAILLTSPRTPDPALGTGATAAARAAGRSADPQASLVAARSAAGDDRAVRLLDVNGSVVAGEPVEASNSRSVAVAPVSPSTGSTVAFAEVSETPAEGRALSAGRVAVLAVCAGALMLLVLFALAAVRRRPRATPPPPAPAAQRTASRAPQPGATAGGDEADERVRLVRGLIAVFDNSDDAYVKSRALDALDDAGVEAIRPEPGDPFDPGTQSIGGVVETVDERRHRDVIAVLRPGFRDHDTLVREAEVQIYVVRADGGERS